MATIIIRNTYDTTHVHVHVKYLQATNVALKYKALLGANPLPAAAKQHSLLFNQQSDLHNFMASLILSINLLGKDSGCGNNSYPLYYHSIHNNTIFAKPSVLRLCMGIRMWGCNDA